MGLDVGLDLVPGLVGSLPGPDTIANLIHWYNLDSLSRLFQDAAKTTPVTANSDPVGAWVDQVVAADTLIQSTAGARPTYRASVALFNNRPGIQFNGSHWMRLASFAAALSQPTTIYAVVREDSLVSTLQHVFNGVTGAARNILRQSSGDLSIFAGASLGATAADLNPHIFTCVFNGASSVFRIDGATSASGNAGAEALTGLTLGASTDEAVARLTGQIAEIIMYSRVLTAVEENTLQSYLRVKYNISVTAVS